MTKEILKQPTKEQLKKITMLRQQSLNKNNMLLSIGFPQLSGITTWEELECVGYNPELSTVEAIVNIKQDSGYSGSLCSTGSPEYVRFFIDYNDGNGFENIGLASFRAYDISDDPQSKQFYVNTRYNLVWDSDSKCDICNWQYMLWTFWRAST